MNADPEHDDGKAQLEALRSRISQLRERARDTVAVPELIRALREIREAERELETSERMLARRVAGLPATG